MKPASDSEKDGWFAEFESTGVYEVRRQVFSDRRKTAASKEWLRKKEATAEWRNKWTFWVALATLVTAVAALLATFL